MLNDPVDGGIQEHNGELRYVEIGFTDALRMLVVITTDRNGLTRVATAFPATPNLRDFYFAEKGYKYER